MEDKYKVLVVCFIAILVAALSFFRRKKNKGAASDQDNEHESRMSHSKRNMKSGVVLKLVTPLTSFITRTVFILV